MNTIIAENRDTTKKAKQLRRSGIVPCVIFGKSLEESISAQINQNIARQLHRTMRIGSKINVEFNGKLFHTLIKDLEYNNLLNEVVHISFLVMDETKPINSVADIVLVNKEKVSGVLKQIQTQIAHSALPEDLLDIVTVNLENMPIGTKLTVGDIPEFRNKKIQLLVDPDSVVLSISDRKRANP